MARTTLEGRARGGSPSRPSRTGLPASNRPARRSGPTNAAIRYSLALSTFHHQFLEKPENLTTKSLARFSRQARRRSRLFRLHFASRRPLCEFPTYLAVLELQRGVERTSLLRHKSLQHVAFSFCQHFAH